MFLPILLLAPRRVAQDRHPHLGFSSVFRVRRFSGQHDFFTLALKNGNPTVVNVILNIQPLISTLGAVLIFNDKLVPSLFLLCRSCHHGRHFSIGQNIQLLLEFLSNKWGPDAWTGYALICAFFWAGSTVAGRGVMLGMSLQLAASMRIVVGLICMKLYPFCYGQFNSAALWPSAAQSHASTRRFSHPPGVNLRRDPRF